MNSSRLPGKALVEVIGKPVIHHVLERVSASRYLNDIIVATTVSSLDDRLVTYLDSQENVRVFRGSESAVLERFFLCAKQFPCDLIVRITADDATYPEGLDIEVFKCSALEKAHADAKLLSEREHVTPYIWKNPHVFVLCNFEYQEDLSGWRWTLDNPDDLVFIRSIYEHFYKGTSVFSYKEVIRFLKDNPHLCDINSHTRRNDGYIRSLEKD